MDDNIFTYIFIYYIANNSVYNKENIGNLDSSNMYRFNNATHSY